MVTNMPDYLDGLYQPLLDWFKCVRHFNEAKKVHRDQFLTKTKYRTKFTTAVVKYANQQPWTGLNPMVTPTSLFFVMFNRWIDLNLPDIGLSSPANDTYGFNDEFPSDLIRIFEQAAKEVFPKTKLVESAIRTSNDFQDVHYGQKDSRST